MDTPRRSRLSPEDRRAQLLDSARTIILAGGLSSFTMEALAKVAGVSNPLVYKYFDSRLQVLQELLQREYALFDREVKERIGAATDYREVVRIFVALNFEQAKRGDVVHLLRDQPDVREALGEQESTANRRVAKFLVARLAEDYPLTQDQALQLVVLASGASRAAAGYCHRYGGDEAEFIDTAVRFIFGGIEDFVPG